MQALAVQGAKPIAEDPISVLEQYPFCAELGPDLARLERQERIELDRQRQQELARQRAVSDKD
jgi:hypothetical protein